MSHKLFPWIVSLFILIFAVPVRNLPVEQAPRRSQVRAIEASTLRAILPPQSTATAQQSLIVITLSATPTSPPTSTFTPTYSVPMLTVREATNCRTGPGKAYEVIVLYSVTQTLEIVGRYEPRNFWLVKSAESPTGTCWLWGEFVDVVGSYWSVVSVTPPPTLPPTPPQAPSLQKWTFSCNSIDNTLSMNIIWEDRATNEAGYRIVRDGWQAAELPAGSTTYAETISMPVSQSAEYYVQAYDATGSADSSVIKLDSSDINLACY